MLNLLPWKFLVKHAARRYGVLDPATVMARIRGFAQPSEVAEPFELLRAGIVFHARGLVNAKAIQHNLDWVWPHWVEQQFNPASPSFVPRAFSFSHINLTHRNWTAVGMPDVAAYPIVDPRGLVTPLHDGWSLDFWIVTESRKRLLPSKLDESAVTQQLDFSDDLKIRTVSRSNEMELELVTQMVGRPDEAPKASTSIRASAQEDGWLVVAIRPYNPEGIQFVHKIEMEASGKAFRVNDEATVDFGEAPVSLRMAHYAEGDVYLNLPGDKDQKQVSCSTGMATAAALFRIEAGKPRELSVSVSLERDLGRGAIRRRSWTEALKGTARLEVADSRMKFLYDAAMRTVVLLSADELVPGPYTYRRFWFRDACLMLHPLLTLGLPEAADRIIGKFAPRQTAAGYFLSQEGEWDSNGQVLWIAARQCALRHRLPDPELDKALRKAVRWLAKKRLTKDDPAGTRGLLPAGFSAEHLGPNDYYYWDDFWAWGGLTAMAREWRRHEQHEIAEEAEKLAKGFATDIGRSIESIPERRSKGAIPAAPGRRMDAGAIGSMVADYPLQLYPAGESRIMATLDWLMDHCFHGGGFFQEMIHSGINAYLTLDLAQTLLRADDPRFMGLVRRVAELASPTGQWPEAIHPSTGGGCMGDGQHGWAAAEWLMMMRSCFVREEEDHLVIGSGILPEWLGSPMSFGPTLTPWGQVSVRLDDGRLEIEATWHDQPPRLIVAVPGYRRITESGSERNFTLEPV
ncbi:hypothetical protein OKA04_14795 [Luteolibacter flavescens]|uniref:Uncharacterized protein n=1 Tax=Luteolibacter flavescens TaxID=1859460 RepID=A0ABT3FQZ0_9BACT|nr:hypothetical protein [Luteolibacter flavescens]MCW1886003.1 hypothetical protein [Luteolibacter flavescens]